MFMRMCKDVQCLGKLARHVISVIQFAAQGCRELELGATGCIASGQMATDVRPLDAITHS
jgi:hypothetical protein